MRHFNSDLKSHSGVETIADHLKTCVVVIALNNVRWNKYSELLHGPINRNPEQLDCSLG